MLFFRNVNIKIPFLKFLAAFAPKLVTFIVDIMIIFMPAIGYIDQCRIIISTRSSAKFKPGTSLVTITSNLLRVIFRFGVKFDKSLLFQAICMAIIHIVLMYLYFRYLSPGQQDKSHSNFRRHIRFITFTHAENFFQFILSTIFMFSIITLVCFKMTEYFPKKSVFNVVGIISNIIESFIPFPQFILIVVKCQIQYITDMLIVQYILAAAFKASIYMIRNVSWVFKLGSLIQCLFTAIITICYIRLRLQNRHRRLSLDAEAGIENLHHSQEHDKDTEAFFPTVA